MVNRAAFAQRLFAFLDGREELLLIGDERTQSLVDQLGFRATARRRDTV